jgi:hypothetical protein
VAEFDGEVGFAIAKCDGVPLEGVCLLDDMRFSSRARIRDPQSDDNPNYSKPYETIQLGIDAHAQWYSMSRQVDGTTPQPVQKMTLEELLLFVDRQRRLAGRRTRDSFGNSVVVVFMSDHYERSACV